MIKTASQSASDSAGAMAGIIADNSNIQDFLGNAIVAQTSLGLYSYTSPSYRIPSENVVFIQDMLTGLGYSVATQTVINGIRFIINWS